MCCVLCSFSGLYQTTPPTRYSSIEHTEHAHVHIALTTPMRPYQAYVATVQLSRFALILYLETARCIRVVELLIV